MRINVEFIFLQALIVLNACAFKDDTRMRSDKLSTTVLATEADIENSAPKENIWPPKPVASPEPSPSTTRRAGDFDVHVQILRMCSTGRSKSQNAVFVEDITNNRVLSIEVEKSTQQSAALQTELIASLDISRVSFENPTTLQIAANLGGLYAEQPSQMEQRVLVGICADTTHDGRCSDERTEGMQNVMRNYLKAEAPVGVVSSLRQLIATKAVSISIFANRHKTRKLNPNQCDAQLSPLVLSFGEKISTVQAKEGPLFDLDHDGHPERVGWVSGNDSAFLVLDHNRNGIIDGGLELFGNATLFADGYRAPNGFAALAQWDSNHDNKIDVFDPVFSRLQLWLDNGNARTEPGELCSLAGKQVQSIDLNYAHVYEQENGNQTRQRSTFTRLVPAGTELGLIVDLWFGDLTSEE
jgi:hypothetical protein